MSKEDTLEEWASKMKQWNDTTGAVHSLVVEDLQKSKVEHKKPKEGFGAVFADPYSVQYSLGYKERTQSLSFEMMKRISKQLSLVAAVLAVRTNQVAAFSAPYKRTKSLGFEIKHKNPARLTTKGEREMIQSLEDFVLRCGAKDHNPHNLFARDNFDTFLRKVVRDTLTFDQVCWEIVPDKRGIPYEFMAIDASTIRLAARDVNFGVDDTYTKRDVRWTEHRYSPGDNSVPYKTMKLYSSNKNERPDYVQVVNNQIFNTFNRDEMFFGVRNPRTDIMAQGYGYPELEQLITIVTAHLNAEEYNRKIFTTGSSPKGIISIKGDAMGTEQMEAFKREWKANMEGVQNSHKTPIVQSDLGVDFIKMAHGGEDIMYEQWMNYLVRITSAVYLIDPEELNFDLKSSGGASPLFEGNNEQKLKSSKDKGLQPLLKFLANSIQHSIINKIDDNFEFSFCGLDELTLSEKIELDKSKVVSWSTINEVRRGYDLPDLKDGDVILNPTYIQSKMQAQQEEQNQQAGDGESGAQAVESPNKAGASKEEAESTAPSYADSFGKSIRVTKEKYIEIEFDLDSWKEGR